MNTWDRLSGAALLVAALVIVYESSKLPLGQLSLPGPGFQPLWAAILLALLSLALIVEASTRRPERAKTLWLAGAGWVKPAAMTAALVGYALVLTKAGYLVATGSLLTFLLVVEGQRWPTVVGVALGATVASYWLFAVWLRVPLPRGVLGMW